MTKPFFYSAAEDVVLLRIVLRFQAHLVGADEVSAHTRSIALPLDVMEVISKEFQIEVRDKITPRPRRSSVSLRARYVRLLEHYASDTLPEDSNKGKGRERENLLKLIIQERAAQYASEVQEDSPPSDPDESIYAEAEDPIDLIQPSEQVTDMEKIHSQSERQRGILLELVASNEREHREFISEYSDMLSDIGAQYESELQALEKQYQTCLDKCRNEINARKKQLMQLDEEHAVELQKVREQRELRRQQLLEKCFSIHPTLANANYTAQAFPDRINDNSRSQA